HLFVDDLILVRLNHLRGDELFHRLAREIAYVVFGKNHVRYECNALCGGKPGTAIRDKRLRTGKREFTSSDAGSGRCSGRNPPAATAPPAGRSQDAPARSPRRRGHARSRTRPPPGKPPSRPHARTGPGSRIR